MTAKLYSYSGFVNHRMRAVHKSGFSQLRWDLNVGSDEHAMR